MSFCRGRELPGGPPAPGLRGGPSGGTVTPMVYTQIAVEETLYEKAQELAQRKGISLEELWLRSLEDVVTREPAAKSWMAFAGMFEGQPEDSSTVDEVVYHREAP